MAAGVVLVLIIKRASALMTPDDPLGGLVRLIAVNTLGMLVALVILGMLFVYLRTALLPFGLGLVSGFICSAVVVFTRGSRATRTSD